MQERIENHTFFFYKLISFLCKALKAFPNLTFYRNPLISAHTWLYFYNKVISFSGDSNFYLVYYEQLILQYKKQLAVLLDFLGLNTNSDINTKRGVLFEMLSETEKKLHSKINDEPDILRIDAWKKELKPLMIKIIEHYTLKIKYIPQYIAIDPSFNVFVRLLIVLVYKMRIIFSIDRY